MLKKLLMTFAMALFMGAVAWAVVKDEPSAAAAFAGVDVAMAIHVLAQNGDSARRAAVARLLLFDLGRRMVDTLLNDKRAERQVVAECRDLLGRMDAAYQEAADVLDDDEVDGLRSALLAYRRVVNEGRRHQLHSGASLINSALRVLRGGVGDRWRKTITPEAMQMVESKGRYFREHESRDRVALPGTGEQPDTAHTSPAARSSSPVPSDE